MQEIFIVATYNVIVYNEAVTETTIEPAVTFSTMAKVTTIKVLSLTSRFSVELDVEGAPLGYVEKYESGTIPYASYTAHATSALTSALRPDGF
jgi:hypothetical protein